MHLKRLELAGFKSFAKKTELFFNSPITSIVGPNGSGKSNVAEAFRWVLGEQSLKSLRGKRGEDLIYNGPEGRLNRASVTVVFDNHQRKFNIDFDEVTITREVFRDGTNEYRINGSQVRLRDILELLSAVSLGSTGHHIISQGEADRILSANPHERRTMIEEALGLKLYQWKILESEKKLVKTDENIRQVESLQREIAPHIKFLKKQVEKIEKADEMRRELKALYRTYFAQERAYLDSGKLNLAGEEDHPRAELAGIEDKLSVLSETINRGEQENPKVSRLSEIERALREARAVKDELSRKLGRLEGMLEIKKERAQVSDDQSDRVVPYLEIKNLFDQLENDLSQAEAAHDIGVIKSTLRSIREAIANFKSKASGSTQAQDLENGINELKAEINEIEQTLQGKIAEETRLIGEQNELKMGLEQDREATLGAEREIFELKARKAELKSKLEAVAARREKLSIEEQDFNRELHEAAALTDREVLEYTRSGVGEEDRSVQEDRRRQIERLKIRLEDMGVEGTDVLEEYKKATEREQFLIKELEDLEKASASLRQIIAELREKLDTDFKQGINKINQEFERFFGLMFGGGNASLQIIVEEKRKRRSDLELSAEMLEEMPEAAEEETKEGIDINVSLPRKKIRGLQMLSGGERALTSIALLFAMSQVNPPPFLILDETDAALDEANSRKYGDMVENLAQHSQLILITHNRETMSRAGVLYGVTMSSDGISKLLSIKFDQATEYAK